MRFATFLCVSTVMVATDATGTKKRNFRNLALLGMVAPFAASGTGGDLLNASSLIDPRSNQFSNAVGYQQSPLRDAYGPYFGSEEGLPPFSPREIFSNESFKRLDNFVPEEVEHSSSGVDSRFSPREIYGNGSSKILDSFVSEFQDSDFSDTMLGSGDRDDPWEDVPMIGENSPPKEPIVIRSLSSGKVDTVVWPMLDIDEWRRQKRRIVDAYVEKWTELALKQSGGRRILEAWKSSMRSALNVPETQKEIMDQKLAEYLQKIVVGYRIDHKGVLMRVESFLKSQFLSDRLPLDDIRLVSDHDVLDTGLTTNEMLYLIREHATKLWERCGILGKWELCEIFLL